MKYGTRKRILQYTRARAGRNWLKKIKFKRYGDLSLYKFFKIFLHNIEEDEILDRSNGVAFNFILAIFPTIIFLFTLIPYISDYFPTISQQNIMEFMRSLLPASMFGEVSSTIEDIIKNQRGSLLTFGFIFAVYLATNGMLALMRAFNSCYRTIEKRGMLRMRLTAFGLTVILSVALFVAVTLLVVGQIAIDHFAENAQKFNINLDDYTIYILLLLRFLVIFILFFIVISCIYYFGPSVHYSWSFFSIGSVLATFAGLAISYGFSYYITNFGAYNKIYGSIGALIALMVWMDLLTLVLLFGYEVNASLHYGRKLQAVRYNLDLKKTKSERGLK
jgi:membrane protein